MIKKAIRHFNRTLLLCFELAGVVALLVLLAWGALLWRLSQGPLDVGFLTTRLEKMLNEKQASFAFDVGTTALTWGGRLKPVELQLKGVEINRADGTPVLTVDGIGIQLSKRRLLFGQVSPKVIRISGPALRVIRWEDNHFTLNLGAPPSNAPAPAADTETQVRLARDLLAMLERQDIPLLGGLQEISITGATAFYEDKILGVAWHSRQTDITFTRDRNGIVAESALALELGAEHSFPLRLNAYYGWDTRQLRILGAFSDFVPALAAQDSETLKKISGVGLPLRGSVALTLDPEFKPGLLRFDVSSGPGTFAWPGLYDAAVDVTALSAAGHVDLKTFEGETERLTADLAGPHAEATVKSTLRDGVNILSVSASVHGTPVDGLKSWWPESLAPAPRGWVTSHLSKGIASKATLDLELALGEKTTVNRLGGRIDFTGVRVDYFPPLLPVEAVDGFATYDTKSFNLDLHSGALGDMTVEKSVIRITGIDTQDEKMHSMIDIDVSLAGPLKTALKVLDGKPLGYPRDLGIKSADVGGIADVDVNFKFPLHKALAINEVKVKAAAKLSDVRIDDMVAGLALTGGPLDLSVDNGAMTVKGSARLGGSPATFTWLKNFGDAPVSSKIEAKAEVEGPSLQKFGLPADIAVTGAFPAEVVHTVAKDGTAALRLKADLGGAAFTTPFPALSKTAGTPGAVEMAMTLKDGKPVRISALSLKTDAALLKGAIDFSGGDMKKAAFSQLVTGETDVSLTVEKAAKGGYALALRGRQADLSEFLKGDGKPGNDADAAQKSTPFTVSLDLGRIITGPGKSIDKPKIFLARNAWRRIERLEMDGVAGGKPLTLRYLPANGGHSLNFQAHNAGAALSALGLTDGVRGGEITVTGAPWTQSGPRDLAGSVILTNFVLVDAPVLARLLNAMSLSGIIELMNGKGIAFKKARATFHWIDRGQPDSAKNTRTIRLKDGETSGASLGLTFEGVVDEWNKTYDLDGTIIPVSDLNKMVSSIPIFGNILTAGGEGVFAATYSVKGPKSGPTVTVNPLAALAPGVLRKLFFEK